ncbi:hypothetical protein T08_16684 [Trichinella sp. T8]|nr:hypothetical protein T08_16684 [Trichinella sp. T8]
MKHTNMALLDMFQKVSSSCKLGSTIDTLQNMGEWPHERNILTINSVFGYFKSLRDTHIAYLIMYQILLRW